LLKTGQLSQQTVGN